MGVLSTTLHELLADNLPDHARRVAVIDPDRSVTYAELEAEVARIAGWLARNGLTPGERVVVHLRKSIDEVAAMFAVARLGGVVVNVNAQWTAEQLGYVIDDCAAALAICGARAAQALAGPARPAGLRRVLSAGAAAAEGQDALAALPRGGPEAVRCLDSALAMIIYTSGSTGKPKGVMLSHRNLVAGARSVARYLRLAGDDRLLSILPYSFDYGLNQLTTMLLLGGSIVHQPVVMPAEIVRAAQAQGVTGIAAVPPLWGQIVRYLAATPVPLPRLRRVTNSGGRIPTVILEAMPEVFPGAEIVLMYGLTEAFRSTYLDPARFAAKKGSIGRAIPGAEVYVIVPGRGIAGPDEEGELVHRGPLVSLGYWGRPALSAEKIRPCPELRHLIGDEPVVWSGDTVRRDAEGDLWFVARADAMIKTSGFRLSPDEVEDLVHRSGLVADVVAFGVEDDDLGEAVHVAVTPLAAFSDDALLRHCRATMPPYMQPRHVHHWPEGMPRTASGKLARPDIIAASIRRLEEKARLA